MWLIDFFVIFTTVSFIYADNNGLIRIPLTRMKSPMEMLLNQNIHPKVIEKLISTYYLKVDNKTVPVPLRKFLDSEFYGTIHIGNQSTTHKLGFNVVFDTAWSNSWVPSVDCEDILCFSKHRYDGLKAQGKDTKTPFSINMGKQNLSGEIWQDKFYINQAKVKDQMFGAVTKMPHIFFYTKADGVLGLGFKSNAFPGSIPVMYNMVKQNLIAKPVVSFYLNRSPGTTKGGTVFFGGIEKRHINGSFTYVDVSEPNSWAFKMDKMTIGDSFSVCKSGCLAVADTSATTIQGPIVEIDAINQYIDAQEFYFGRYTISCSRVASLPDVVLNINGQKFPMKGRDYVQQMSFGPIKVCLTAFKRSESEEDKTWLIGGAFFSAYYVSFDLGNLKIGFAKSLP